MLPGFQMTFGVDPGAVPQVIERFAAFAEAEGLSATVRRSIQVALDEFVYNSIVYGFADRGTGEGSVRVEVGDGRVTVTIADDGPRFDPLAFAVPDTGLSVEEREIGGLGIHLVRQMMDEMTYRYEGGRNIVVLVKRLASGSKDGQQGARHMEISTRAQRDITIVALTGNLDSNTSPQAQQAIDGILAGGGKKLVVDFSTLDYISSAGLRVLLGAAKKLQGGGGALRLFGLNDSVREVFEISGFSKILTVKGSEGEALAGL